MKVGVVKAMFYYVLLLKTKISCYKTTLHEVGAKRLKSSVFLRHSGAARMPYEGLRKIRACSEIYASRGCRRARRHDARDTVVMKKPRSNARLWCTGRASIARAATAADEH